MNILITGSRSPVALELVRNFGKHNCNVYTADSINKTIASYSSFAKKNFLISSPRFNECQFISDLINIIKEFKIDVLFPTCEEIFYISKNKYKIINSYPKIKIIAETFEKLNSLHDKYNFFNTMKHLLIPTPQTYLINNVSDIFKNTNFSKVPQYILKPIFSRFGSQIKIINSKQEISSLNLSNNRWILQEFLKGKLVCFYCYCKSGKIKFHITYSSKFSSDVNALTLFENFENDNTIFKIASKISDFYNFTGNLSFDFIYDGNQFYILECNPRITSGIHLLSQNNMYEMFFNNISPLNILKSNSQIRLLNLLSFKNYNLEFIKNILNYPDILFDKKDIKPFLMSPLSYYEMLKIKRRLKSSIMEASTYDIEWNNDERL